MTHPVRPSSAQDQAWADLATELTPAKSLARIDTVTARAVTTITVVGVLLTGLGALSAVLPAQAEPSRALAVAAVITATLAVASALAAQVLTITHRLNPANLTEVKAWYRRQFVTRAYPTQVATLLLLLAALLAGAAATAALLTTPPSAPTITVSQTLRPDGTATGVRRSAVAVTVTFRGLVPGQVTTVIIATPGVNQALARAAATAAPDGTAATRLAVGHLTVAQPVVVTARAC